MNGSGRCFSWSRLDVSRPVLRARLEPSPQLWPLPAVDRSARYRQHRQRRIRALDQRTALGPTHLPSLRAKNRLRPSAARSAGTEHRPAPRWPGLPSPPLKAFRHALHDAKRQANVQFTDWLKSTSGQTVDPDIIFDCQIKRIHEYKRQLLNALRIIVLYNRLRENPGLDMAPRTFFFAGRAAPVYRFAKLIIKFAIISPAPSTATQ
jgi:hypothetical protein